MKNIFATLLLLIFISMYANAQFPGGNMGGRNMNAGHFYGKIVDEKTGKGIEFVAVELTRMKMDSVSNTKKETIITGGLTSANGDFSMESVPVLGEFTLKVSAMVYKPYEQKVSFNLKMPGQGGGDMQKMLSAIDKDLGNIKLSLSSVNLTAVTVESEAPAFELKIDKKVYNVEKHPVNAGGTAEDVLKNIPSITVDIDNNVKLRNAAPQIFVDGRPTTLTIDQIPADAIESVEVITNPSAKYDASGGMGGILNIVLKKNRRIGYNGSVRTGIDSHERVNASGDLNVRQGKINIFVGGNINQRKTIQTGHEVRDNLIGAPLTDITLDNTTTTLGYFAMGRAGIDYFIDNRNTLTVSGLYNHGNFAPHDESVTVTDSLYPVITSSSSHKITNSSRGFRNLTGVVSFKHIFPKEGMEWTADANYNQSKSIFNSTYQTQDYLGDGTLYGGLINQQQLGSGANKFFTTQTDFVDPLSDKMKIEAGGRAAIRGFESVNNNYISSDSLDEFQYIPAISDNYKYTDQVYAAYITFSNQIKKFGYQAGLRAESSFYTGEEFIISKTFNNNYPISLFPSAFFSYKLNEKNNFQLNYTRRINRPTFFQLLPYTDYTDSLNLSRGNAGLKPEFTNSIELTWQRIFSRKNSFIASAYLKNTNDLITRYQLLEFDTVLNHSAIISTYENANSAYAYGMEFILQNSFVAWWDVTASVNAYNSTINGSNIQANLSNSQFSWFAKMNNSFKLPKNFSLQLSGEYQSKTSLQISSASSGGRGGMVGGGGFGGGPVSTAQGYVRPFYSLDAAIKFEFTKNKMASLTLSCSDVFKTRVNDVYSSTLFFTQDNLRKRDQQFFRLNFSYRFGKFDTSLFKRKNTNQTIDVPDIGL